MGTPAVNLVEGNIDNGVFRADRIEISGLDAARSGPVIPGFYAENAGSSSSSGEITAPVYSMELLGESSMVTLRAGGAIVTIEADKEYSAQISETVTASVPASCCHLFYINSGERID